jgi:hypothetical protein
MKRVLSTAALAFFTAGCASNAGMSCTSSEFGACTDYVSGFTEASAESQCMIISAGTFSSTMPCPSAGRVGRCRGVSTTTGATIVTAYYAPRTAAELEHDCVTPGGDVAGTSTFEPE